MPTRSTPPADAVDRSPSGEPTATNSARPPVTAMAGIHSCRVTRRPVPIVDNGSANSRPLTSSGATVTTVPGASAPASKPYAPMSSAIPSSHSGSPRDREQEARAERQLGRLLGRDALLQHGRAGVAEAREEREHDRHVSEGTWWSRRGLDPVVADRADREPARRELVREAWQRADRRPPRPGYDSQSESCSSTVPPSR